MLSICLLSVFLSLSISFLLILPPPRSTLFPYTTLFRSRCRLQLVILSSSFNGRVPSVGSPPAPAFQRSEEHTSELQSRGHLVCRLLLEKKKKKQNEMDCRLHICKYS